MTPPGSKTFLIFFIEEEKKFSKLYAALARAPRLSEIDCEEYPCATVALNVVDLRF